MTARAAISRCGGRPGLGAEARTEPRLIGLSRRAQRFIETEGIRVRQQEVRRHHDAWIEHGIPAAETERATAFQDRWGALALPPAPLYEGGPRILDAGCSEETPAEGWSFPAGDCRVSMAYSFTSTGILTSGGLHGG